MSIFFLILSLLIACTACGVWLLPLLNRSDDNGRDNGIANQEAHKLIDVKELEAHQRGLVATVRDLDLEYGMGSVAASEYEETRLGLLNELNAVVEEIKLRR